MPSDEATRTKNEEATVTRVSLDQVLADIGLGPFHARLTVVAGLGFAASAIEEVLTAFLFPELRHHWKMTEYALGALPSISGFGSIIGEFFWGHVADHYGRRPVFMITVFIVVIFGIASSFSSGYGSLYALRLAVGFGYGGNIAVDFVLFSEFLPTQGRGAMLFAMSAFWPLGQCVAVIIAWLVIPSLGWRWYLIFCALPSLAVAFLRPLFPESPRWLLLHGRDEEALEICQQIAFCNGKCLEDLGIGPGVKLTLDNETAALLDGNDQPKEICRIGALRLFEPGLWRTTLGSLILVASLGWSGYITSTFLPSFLVMKGIPKLSVYVSMLASSLSQFPGVVVAWLLATTLGRRLPISVSLLCVGVAMVFFAFARNKAVVVFWSCLQAAFLEFGWALFHTYLPEVYPTELRATAIGFITALGSLISVGVPMFTAWIVDTRGDEAAIITVAAVSGFVALITWLLFNIETMDRDLSDRAIQLRKTNMG